MQHRARAWAATAVRSALTAVVALLSPALATAALTTAMLAPVVAVAAPAPAATAPTKPTGVRATVSRTTVSVSWVAASDDRGVASYDVFRNGTWVGWTRNTTFTNTAVPAGTHRYTVNAVDTDGNWSGRTAPLTVVVPVPPPEPTKPTAVTATVSGTSVHLGWRAADDDRGIAGYDVFRNGTWVGWTRNTTFTNTAVPAGTHRYTVNAVDTDGNWSGRTAPRTVTVSPPPSDERFRVAFPHVFVDTATGVPAYLNGVNLNARVVDRRVTVSRNDLDRIRAAGFNTIRLVMYWPEFQPTAAGVDTVALDDLVRVLHDADAAGLHVILDPLHSTGPGYFAPNWFNVPTWVWAAAPAATTEAAAEEAMLAKLDTFAPAYLQAVARRVASHPSVVAIDLVSEARAYPPVAADPALSAQNRLLRVYDRLISTVRAVDPDQILLIEPVYGNSDLRQADFGLLQPANRVNVAVSIHDYYGGGHPTGFDAQGTGTVGRHVWDGTVGYPVTEFDRSVLRSQLYTHVRQTVDLLRPWRIPLHIGEYAINPDLPGSYEWIEDTTAVFDRVLDDLDPGRPAADVRLSRTWWRWTHDSAFQLYRSAAGTYRWWVIDLLVR